MVRNKVRLDRRITFFSPIEVVRTRTGGSRNGWNEAFKAWGAVRYLRGGEGVLASRMQGRRPAVLIMRKLQKFDNIRLDWIVKFDEETYQVRELPKRRPDGATIEMLVEAKS